MQTDVWNDVVEDLESLCVAWRLIAAGDQATIAELPNIPADEPPDFLLPRLLAVQEELERVRGVLDSALTETQTALTDLRTAHHAAGKYLSN